MPILQMRKPRLGEVRNMPKVSPSGDAGTKGGRRAQVEPRARGTAWTRVTTLPVRPTLKGLHTLCSSLLWSRSVASTFCISLGNTGRGELLSLPAMTWGQLLGVTAAAGSSSCRPPRMHRDSDTQILAAGRGRGALGNGTTPPLWPLLACACADKGERRRQPAHAASGLQASN